MTNKPILNFVVEPAMLKRLDDFWHKHRFPSRAAAVKWLLVWALEKDPKVDDAVKLYSNQIAQLRKQVATLKAEPLSSSDAQQSLRIGELVLDAADVDFPQGELARIETTLNQAGYWLEQARREESRWQRVYEIIRPKLDAAVDHVLKQGKKRTR